MAGGKNDMNRNGAGLAAALITPILLVNAIVFIVPIVNLLRISFNEALPGGGIGPAFTWENWVQLVADTYYLEILLRSIGVSVLITVLTLLLSYPIALYLHRASGAWRTFLFVLVIAPLLTSAVVRTYGWIAMLADGGLINNALGFFGAPVPFRLLFNLTGVVIGLTEILMPYMILALLAGFGRLDPRCEEAALTLGARPWQSFWRIVVPLTAPGIALGCFFCFVLCVSSFITPRVLGGGRVFLLATEIYDQAIVTLNWPAAATLSILVLLLFGTALTLYTRALRSLD
ncbi:ABC transporter permease [Bosea sp. 685]|uniref:ABC transporter permease n=1 Tax=Bosea sp. 685 TaxID=3080057 RepID=UPI0028934518|nr:ABC transporter permease [Bosea sp. 685]WNJ88861.1 ABC transporter permease [Bosea sp. 685]